MKTVRVISSQRQTKEQYLKSAKRTWWAGYEDTQGQWRYLKTMWQAGYYYFDQDLEVPDDCKTIVIGVGQKTIGDVDTSKFCLEEVIEI